MLTLMREIFNECAGSLRAPLIGIYTLLSAANLAAWAWALVVFRDQPILLGTACSPTVLVCATPWTPTISRQSTT